MIVFLVSLNFDTGPSEGFRYWGVNEKKRTLMRSEHALGFLVSVFGRDGYFKYCK